MCNTSENNYFRDIADAALSRRALLGLGGVAAAAVAIGVDVAQAAAGLRRFRRRRAGRRQAAVHARSHRWSHRGRGHRPGRLQLGAGHPLGRPALPRRPGLRHRQPDRGGAGAAVRLQQRLPGHHRGFRATSAAGVLFANHEYTNEDIMFPAGMPADPTRRAAIAMAAHGLSVVELRAQEHGPSRGRYVRGAQLNRRITEHHRVRARRPRRRLRPAQDRGRPDRPRVLGTLGNCAGGTTPWGTVLSGEENFNGYFPGPDSAADKRYGTATAATDARLGTRSTRASTPATPATRTRPTASAGSWRSTRSIPRPPPSSTPRWAASSTRAPTSIIADVRPCGGLHRRRRALRLPVQVRLARTSTGAGDNASTT